MIKIKLLESDIHRNETTFRPFLYAQNILRDIGIEFTDSDDYDFAWVGQASIIDKKKSLAESIDKGLEFISKISGDYMIVDGQDSTSLISTIDVFRESNALLFLKNSYLKEDMIERNNYIHIDSKKKITQKFFSIEEYLKRFLNTLKIYKNKIIHDRIFKHFENEFEKLLKKT